MCAMYEDEERPDFEVERGSGGRLWRVRHRSHFTKSAFYVRGETL